MAFASRSAAACPASFTRRFSSAFGVPLLDGYGSTETNFVFAGTIPSGSSRHHGPSRRGRRRPASSMPTTCVLPDGDAGELLLRARRAVCVLDRLFRDAGQDRSKPGEIAGFTPATASCATRDGHYRFIDRMKDSIRRRGENVSSWEVEQVLLTHPAIAACAVYPLPSELGEDGVAAADPARGWPCAGGRSTWSGTARDGWPILLSPALSGS